MEEDSKTRTSKVQKLQDRPLYFWLKSFAGREIRDDAELTAFVSSNALNYVLEYIGITPENEQSSLHLSAIFDEDSPTKKYPTHYESETKSRIQSLNKTFLELKSFFEDRFSQVVAIRPPNSVHIASSCDKCSVQEFEKLILLLLGASIQGSQKQDTIRTIKRFPSNIQEALIGFVKLIADNPEILNVKSWDEFLTLKAEEQKIIYENLISLIRKLILERNDLASNQLITDYFVGYTNCDQKREYGLFTEYEKASEDMRLSSSVRQLREQLIEKSELLQECREELEKARNIIQDLEVESNDMKQKHRAMKKARDELDALREGHEKAARLETELSRVKARLEESELVYERVESLEIENKNWQVKHDMLLDQISFLSFERSSSRDTSFDQMSTYTGILDGLAENLKDFKDDDCTLFDSDHEEPSVKENLKKELEDVCEEDEDDHDASGDKAMNTSTSTIQPDSSPEKEDILEHPENLDISQTESIDSGNNLVTSTPKSSVEHKSQEVQTPTHPLRGRRRILRPLNLKTKRSAIIIPVTSSGPSDEVDEDDKDKTANSPLKSQSSQIIQLYKIYNLKKKGPLRPRKFRSPTKKRNPSDEKQVVPNLENEGNEADEELSISPTGNSNLSDLDSNNDVQNGTDNDSEIYFVCSPQSSGNNNGTPEKCEKETPPGFFGTTTAFPISNINNNHSPGLRRTEFAFNPQNLSDLHYNLQNQNHSNSNSNHLTAIYSRQPLLSPPSPPHNNHQNRTTTTTTINYVPYSEPSRTHNAQIGPSSNSDQDQEDDDALNAFTLGDYNIQLNLRNSIKPSTALINKISTLSTNRSPHHNSNNNNNSYNQYSPQYQIETSSEDDGSIWYEYGCV